MLTREQSIRATFDIFKPDGVIEVRAMAQKTFSGYYKNRAKLIEDLSRHDDKTWYFVMNDINDACYSREQSEKILSVNAKMKTTGDKEIERIKWILIDADPVRAAGVSATDAEKKASYEIIGKVAKYLSDIGFSEPVFCDSGNGYHLLYRVNLAVSSSEDVKKFLQALDVMFSDGRVEIDTSVFNPSRITKVYGTVARKGANTEERPWRSSRILHIPDAIEQTSIALIKSVIDVIPEPPKPTYQNNYTESFDIDNFLRNNGIAVNRDIISNGTRKIVLERCPFDSNHKAPDPAIFVMSNGAIGFHCFHNSCRDKRWQDVRKLYDPLCYERRQEQSRRETPQPIVKQSEKQGPTQPTETEEHFRKLADIEVIDRSQIVSIKTGIKALDSKIIGMNKGELSIWSGGNGSGKSTILSQLALKTVEYGFKVAMFSGELTNNRAKTWIQLQAAGRNHVKQSADGISYYVPKMEAELIDEWIADKLWLYNNNYGTKVYDVLQDFENHMQKHHTDVVIIDNLMSLDLSDIRGEKYDRQTALVLSLSELAKKYDIHVHFVCHPRKPNGFLRKADISGTSDLTNAADNVFMMHRVNKDFMRLSEEFLGKGEVENYRNYSNVMEVMKNRDLGVSDEFIGLYFEQSSKRMLNEPSENITFGWEDDLQPGFVKISAEELEKVESEDELPF